MKNITVTINNEGLKYIKITKDASVFELNNLCTKIRKGLMEQGYFDAIVNFGICNFHAGIYIDIYEKKYKTIGSVQFLAVNRENAECYELVFVSTPPENEEWTTDKWIEYEIKVVSDVFKILQE